MDQLDLGNDGYFTSLMQSDCNEDQFVMESQYLNPNAQVFSHETEFTPVMGSSSKKPPRRTNFTMEEDKMLVSAWLNISMDPVQGNNQKKATFWQRVKEFIEDNMPNATNRTTVSLQCRWSAIQICTNKFCSCYSKVLSLNQSGINEENKIQNAKDMYKQFNGSAFLFEHCWVILKNQPKWFLECEKRNQLKRSRKGVASCPSDPYMVNLEDDNVATDSVVDLEGPTDNVVDLERPIGSKAKKVQVKKQKDQIASLTLISGALDEIKEGKKLLLDKKLEMLAKIHDQEQEKIRIKKESLQKTHDQEQEKIRIKRERLEMDQFKEDERVMMMNLNGLSEGQQEFYRHKQMEILEKRRAK
ncbi:hypothetical protein Vadar_015386 [Vaccinium darrowii]|uniref:Uncharacterized protein n=1 Tax=Vaccinium darrowii TaxID=229202 RepID=A0ACB7XAI4_9ERIC|nr:hypothetical protein Vadar_015386 [Vaccinium darrowii]